MNGCGSQQSRLGSRDEGLLLQVPATKRLNSEQSNISRSVSVQSSLKSWEKRLLGISNGNGSNSGNSKLKSKNLKETKATITLATVVLCFAVCWIPYFALFTVKPFLQEPINCHIDLFVLWLGYVNSAINPFLYAFYNSHFRSGFYRVLCPRRYQRAMRQNLMDEMSWRYTNASNYDVTEGFLSGGGTDTLYQTLKGAAE